MSVVLSSGGSWTRQERNWTRRAQGARLDSDEQEDALGPDGRSRPGLAELGLEGHCSAQGSSPKAQPCQRGAGGP